MSRVYRGIGIFRFVLLRVLNIGKFRYHDSGKGVWAALLADARQRTLLVAEETGIRLLLRRIR
jgi:hypothetical protein